MVVVNDSQRNVETRMLSFDQDSLLFDDEKLHVKGYVNKSGSVSQVLSEDGQKFREQIDPMAFVEAIEQTNHPIDFYFEHDDKQLLATTANGSLKLSVDDVGLLMEANMLQTQTGQDAYTMIKSGVIKGMSFGFIATDDTWNYSGDIPLRIVTKLMLLEVSAVRYPAYLDSEIEARGLTGEKEFVKLGYNAISSVKLLEKEDNCLDLTEISSDELRTELEKRGLKVDLPIDAEPEKSDQPEDEPIQDETQTEETRATKKAFNVVPVKTAKRDDEDSTGDFSGAVLNLGDDAVDAISQMVTDQVIKKLGETVFSEDDETRAKFSNIVPVKAPKKRDDDPEPDEPIETDSIRSMVDDIDSFLKTETPEK